MQTWEITEHKLRFLELVQEADSIESLRWCQKALEKQMARLCADRARSIHNGERVEVTEGPLAGVTGTVIAHCCRSADMLMVDLDGVALDVPMPIPAAALRVLVRMAVLS